MSEDQIPDNTGGFSYKGYMIYWGTGRCWVRDHALICWATNITDAKTQIDLIVD